jgi:hypothetical protein
MEHFINVKLKDPTICVSGWTQEAEEWIKLNAEINGNSYFYPLTIKFGYLFGVIHDICECVACLLHDRTFARRTSYVPAYGLLASGIEILGRCVKGESDTGKSTLIPGLRWLAESRYPQCEQVSESLILITTSRRSYTIKELAQLRNYTAHGQAVSSFQTIDYQIIEQLQPLFRDALQCYWECLTNDEDTCNRLALANIVQLRGWPVLKTWMLLQGNTKTGNQTIISLFNKFEQSFQV